MHIMDYFRPVSTWSAEKVREFLESHDPGEYNLVDVRQPKEYEKEHLPGAKHIPVGEIAERVGELDPARPTITYCALGARSRAAASFLHRAGFHEVYSMEGGMKAWKGITAEGLPEAGTIYFSEARSTEEIIALAWLLEEGSQKFYETLSKTVEDDAASELFAELVQAESHHKGSLERLYADRTRKSAVEVSELLLKASKGAEVLMEGGMRLDHSLAWAEGRIVREILGFSISLEASAYDRYLYMLHRATDEGSREVFRMLAGEEKRHLGRLGELVESML